MLEIAVLIAIFVSIYLAWSVGVHTMGSSIGISMGSGVLSLRTAAILTGFFAVLGAIFLSPRIIETIGNDLVILDSAGLLAVMISVGVLITLFAYKETPIFTTYLIMGGILGYTLVSNITLNMLIYGEILISLLSSPIVAMCTGFLIYELLKWFKNRRKGISKKERFEKMFVIPSFIAIILLSIVIGANSVGVVVGVLGSRFDFLFLGIIGSIGVLIGLFTWSYKIAMKVGIEITDLSPIRGFSAQLATAAVMFGFILLSIPVSTTQTLVGATIGVGLSRGRVRRSVAKSIGFSWLVGLPASIGFGALLGLIL